VPVISFPEKRCRLYLATLYKISGFKKDRKTKKSKLKDRKVEKRKRNEYERTNMNL